MKTEVAVKDIMDTLKRDSHFKEFGQLVIDAGLEKILRGDQELTIFAPVEGSLKRLNRKDRETLKSHGRSLEKIVAFHILQGRLVVSEIMQLDTLRTLEGETLKVSPCDGVKINGIDIVRGDIDCSNGMIHGIDGILIPDRL